MKYLLSVVVSFVLASVVLAGDVIQYADGTQVEAPAGYKAVFVPVGTGNTLIAVEAVKLKRPKAPVAPSEPTCAKPGELVLGPTAPCAD